MSMPALLLIGSLPLTASHAALLMDRLARTLSVHSAVTCLIDPLAPLPTPQDQPLPYRVMRYSDSAAIQDVRALPRLYVLGAGGDSLFAFEMMAKAPGSVIFADNSLLSLTPALQAIGGFGSLSTWLEERYGTAGGVAADAIIHHRRFSAALSAEICAYGYAHVKDCAALALNRHQQVLLSADGVQAQRLMCANNAALPNFETATELPASVSRLCIIGASPTIREAVLGFLESSPLKTKLSLTWHDRFDAALDTALKGCDAAVILDGHGAACCPYFLELVAARKPVLTAGQVWAREYHAPHIVPGLQQSPDQHAPALFHALAFCHTDPAAMQQLQYHQAWAYHKEGAGLELSPETRAALLGMASQTMLPLYEADIQDAVKPLSAIAATSLPDTAPATTLDAGAIAAYIGAVPITPILSGMFPATTAHMAPKFCPPDFIAACAAFVRIPPQMMAARMGYEATMIQTITSDANETRHLKQWHSARWGLTKENGPAIIWGYPPEHFAAHDTSNAQSAPVLAAPRPSGHVTWRLKLPAKAVHLKPNQTDTIDGLDGTTGIFWRYDPVRKRLKIVFATGGAGTLTLSTKKDDPALNFYEALSGIHAPEPIIVSDHGVVCLEITTSNLKVDENHPMLALLCHNGLLFDWEAR